MPDTVDFEIHGGAIRLRGFVDRYTVNALIKGIVINQINCERLSLDFTEVEKVDTAGLAWILKVMAQARQSGQVIHLISPPAQLINLATISGVEQLLSQ